MEKHTSHSRINNSQACCIAHDLNNMLTVISLNLSLLEQTSNRGAENNLENVKKALDLSKNMVSQLQSILTYDSVGKTYKKYKVDIEGCINKVCSVVSTATERQINLEISGTPIIHCISSIALERLLFNLVWNATDSISEKKDGFILVKAEETASENIRKAVISVTDNGRGIKDRDLKKVFIDGFTTGDKGLGKGLFICKEIAEENGGTIEVRSKEGQGAEFTVTLPV